MTQTIDAVIAILNGDYEGAFTASWTSEQLEKFVGGCPDDASPEAIAEAFWTLREFENV